MDKFRLLLKYKKDGPMRYIGHMDFVRVFQRAVKRSGIIVAYSGGFNPRQRISFALPLPVGSAGLSEYAEIVLDGPAACGQIAGVLNKNLPEGAEIVSERPFGKNEKGPASTLIAARYAVCFTDADGRYKTEKNELDSAVSVLLNGGADEAAHIITIDIINDGAFELTVPHGNKKNLKPGAVAGLLCGIMNWAPDPLTIKYTRLEMYKDKDGRLVPIFDE